MRPAAATHRRMLYIGPPSIPWAILARSPLRSTGRTAKEAGEPDTGAVKKTGTLSPHLLSIVVPGSHGAVREHPIHDQRIWQDVHPSRPPFTPQLQPIPLHLPSIAKQLFQHGSQTNDDSDVPRRRTVALNKCRTTSQKLLHVWRCIGLLLGCLMIGKVFCRCLHPADEIGCTDKVGGLEHGCSCTEEYCKCVITVRSHTSSADMGTMGMSCFSSSTQASWLICRTTSLECLSPLSQIGLYQPFLDSLKALKAPPLAKPLTQQHHEYLFMQCCS